jgi:hypothetical protein
MRICPAVCRRIKWGTGIGVLLLGLVVGLLVFADAYALAEHASGCAPSLRQSKWPMYFGCLMAAHEDLAAGLLGGAGALWAAWLAFQAIQEQIEEERNARERQNADEEEDRRRQQAEAKEAAVICITPAIHAAAVALAAVKVATEINAVVDEPADQIIATEAAHIRSGIDFFTVRESIGDLNVGDKLIYLTILGSLSTFIEVTVHPSPMVTRRGRLHAQHRALMNLHTFLRPFDTELADVYGRDSGTAFSAATPKTPKE